MDWPGHLPPQILMLIFALCFTWRHIYAILNLLGRSWMDLLCTPYFLLTIGSTCLYVLKLFFLGLGKFWVLQRHICFPISSVVLWCLQSWQLVFSWCPSCRQVTGPEFLPMWEIIFLHTSLLWIGIRILFTVLFWVSVSCHLVFECQSLTCIKSGIYVWLSDHSCPQY